MSAMEEAIQEFTSECEEMLERISLSLTRLEKEDLDQETISSIYRDMHTIKGSSQLFGFNQIGSVAHAMESSLDPIRQNIIKPNSNLIDIIYQGCDLIGRLVKSINETQAEYEAEDELLEIVPKLIDMTIRSIGGSTRFLRDDFVGFDVVQNAPIVQSEDGPIARTQSQQEIVSEPSIVEEKEERVVEPAPPMEAVAPSPPVEMAVPPPPPEPPVEAKSAPAPAPAPAPEPPVPQKTEKAEAKPVKPSQPAASTRETEIPNITKPKAPKKTEIPSPTAKVASKESAKAADKKSDSQETIRVQVSLLDKLMNLAGELVLVRNQVLRFASNEKNQEFSKLAQKVNLVTTEIQNEVMKTRMQPVGSILSKFHRVVRDLAKELGKKIELKLEGTETELDKTLIEAVKDPLTHIVRNSADHGLETPEERVENGKTDTGRIIIKSYHEGGQVVIEISDNGRGLSRDKIGEKALEKGIVTLDQLGSMSDKEVHQLIFAPGFSTAASISNISGRGVGMDVVKTNIERIGGIIDLSSNLGKGTTIFLKIPLTLAIVPALLIRSMEKRFAIPQVKLLELLRIDFSEKDGTHQIENLQGKPIYRLRGQLLPLVCLDQLLEPSLSRPRYLDQSSCNIVVLKAGNIVFGLIVDEIEDSADIVVKPLTQFLKSLGLYAGATLLGDGNVALTLDVMGIAEKACLTHGEEEADFLQTGRKESTDNKAYTDYLVVDVGDKSQYTFPLSIVNRLEEFKTTDFDYSGDQKVVRYRGQLLPIISIRDFFGYGTQADDADENKVHSVVVVQRFNRLFGLEVDSILDVISSSAVIDDHIKSHSGILGSFIEKDRVFVVIDTSQVIQQYSFENGIQNQEPTIGTKNKVIVVEDSKFFRNHIKKFLEGNGFDVITAENGEEGLDQILEYKDELTLIISDIEMPKMDGYALASNVSNDDEINHIPMIAVTTRFREADIQRGKQCGFDSYLEKLNEEQLLNAISSIMQGSE